MAGKQITRSKSPLVVLTLLLVALSLLFFFLLSFHSDSPAPFSDGPLHPNPIYKPETSFVASLERFLLAHDSPPPTVRSRRHKPEELDDLLFKTETRRLYADPYYPLTMPIRVYVYEMPAKFTYDLLRLFISSYKDTSNLTSNGSPVHRLIEQHSIDYWLWADLLAPESERLLKSVVRVHRQEEADLFYIPFFTTISFFLMEKQQCKSLYRV